MAADSVDRDWAAQEAVGYVLDRAGYVALRIQSCRWTSVFRSVDSRLFDTVLPFGASIVCLFPRRDANMYS